MTHNPTPLDFTKVEALRKHMLLTTSDMASILGISRMTYYGWVKGKPVRKSNHELVKATLKRLLAVMVEDKWPTPEVIGMEQSQRKATLDEILKRFN
jgi:DNA-binding XRE family transcriptional regulator